MTYQENNLNLKKFMCRPSILLLFFLCIPGLTHVGRAEDIAFFYALDADYQAFKAQAHPLGQPVLICGRSVQRLDVAGHRVYAVKMGSGAVETAISASALMSRFRCDLAISVGPVGALDDRLQIGEWRQVGTVICYQKGSWNTAGFQAFAPTATDVTPRHLTPPIVTPPLTAAVAAESLTVASGEIFVASSVHRDEVHSQTGAQAIDMNLFGLTTACAAAKVPLWSWRIVSDRADDEASVAFRAFVEKYNGEGGKALAETVRQLPADLNSPETYPELRHLMQDPKVEP